MCGIAGTWSRIPQRMLDEGLKNALRKIEHRGPDDVGVCDWNLDNGGRVSLGSTRLAILDLSPAGHMPMETVDGRYAITYNGEITNYVEVRKQLQALGHGFRSGSDTEVLLTAWTEWGHKCLERLEGMFAFAIVDRERRTLTLARDSFGVKPLFYAYEPGESLVFCSELPALLTMRAGKPQLCWQTAIDYLQWGSYDGASSTFITGVEKLLPANFITFDIESGTIVQAERYWWPSVDTDATISIGDAAETVRELFLQSVRNNLRSDVPVGVALSGGIDSSAIACSMRYLEPDIPIQSFSFVAPGFAESEHEWVDQVVRATGAQSHLVSTSGSELLQDLDEMILAQGEPFGSTSIYAQYKIFQKVREQGVVVMLEGQGADEMFAGYSGYPGYRLHSLIETGKWGQASSFLREWSTWPGRTADHAIRETIAQLIPMTASRFMDAVRPGSSPLIDYTKLRERGIRTGAPRLAQQPHTWGKRLKDQLRTHLMVRGLPALLRHGDRNSMHFSIESRVPFLDRSLVQYALTLPESFLVAPDGTSKDIFRRAMRGIVPDAVLDRRDKVGFSTPQQTWLTELYARSGSRAQATGDSEIGFLRTDVWKGAARDILSEDELALGAGSHWRLLNLRRWVELLGIDAS